MNKQTLIDQLNQDLSWHSEETQRTLHDWPI